MRILPLFLLAASAAPCVGPAPGNISLAIIGCSADGHVLATPPTGYAYECTIHRRSYGQCACPSTEVVVVVVSTSGEEYEYGHVLPSDAARQCVELAHPNMDPTNMSVTYTCVSIGVYQGGPSEPQGHDV